MLITLSLLFYNIHLLINLSYFLNFNINYYDYYCLRNIMRSILSPQESQKLI